MDAVITAHPWAAPSVDRLDTSRGYHLDNIRITPLPANRLNSALVRKLVNADQTPDHFKPDHFEVVSRTIAEFFGPSFEMRLTDKSQFPILVRAGETLPLSIQKGTIMLWNPVSEDFKKLCKQFNLTVYDTASAKAKNDPNGVYPITVNTSQVDYDLNRRNQIRLEQATEMFDQSVDSMMAAHDLGASFPITLFADAKTWRNEADLSPKNNALANVDGRTRMETAHRLALLNGDFDVPGMFTNCTDFPRLRRLARAFNCRNGNPPSETERIRYAVGDLKDLDEGEIKSKVAKVCKSYGIDSKVQTVLKMCAKNEFDNTHANNIECYGKMKEPQKQAIFEMVNKIPKPLGTADSRELVVRAFADVAHDRGENMTPEVIKAVSDALENQTEQQQFLLKGARQWVMDTIKADSVGMAPSNPKSNISSVILNKVTELKGRIDSSVDKMKWSDADGKNLIVMLKEITGKVEKRVKNLAKNKISKPSRTK